MWFWLHAPLGLAAFVGGVLGVVFGAKLPQDGLSPTVLDAHKVSTVEGSMRWGH